MATLVPRVVAVETFSYTLLARAWVAGMELEGGAMGQSSSADVTVIQKLLLRAAAAAASGTPIPILPGETPDSVNDSFVTALGIISRSSRLEAVLQAVRPIAARLANTPIEGESEEAEEFRSHVQHLLASLAALQAYDHREADHTIVD
jgi:hypothetical protein